jgi:hypothetical protein
VRIANDPLTFLEAVSGAGSNAEVVVEATYGWYWAVDWSRPTDTGCIWRIRRATTGGNRRVKNDERDARDLADLLRVGGLAVEHSTSDEPIGQ